MSRRKSKKPPYAEINGDLDRFKKDESLPDSLLGDNFEFKFSDSFLNEELPDYNERVEDYLDTSLGAIKERAWENLAYLTQIMSEVERREMAALNLYNPLPFQEDYHKCRARTVVLRKGNRAGGSLAGFMEDARAVLGKDPYNKWPKNGTLICLGYGESHIANVIYKMLFAPGAFDIIRDLSTGKWRVFRNWFEDCDVAQRLGMPGDRGREEEIELSPPLIEPQFINKEVWVNKGGRIFKEITVKTPDTEWNIVAANSNGDPRHMQGFNSDIFHIDEDIAKKEWYTEQRARLIRRRGKLRWTAMPHGDNECLQTVIDTAEDLQSKSDPNPHTVVISATIRDNPYLPEEEVEAFIQEMWALGDDEYNKRVLGVYNSTATLVYDRFRSSIHDARSEHAVMTPALEQYIAEGYFPPRTWTRYVAIDPGWTVFAVLFCAVPPPELGHQIFFYDELYIRGADAQLFAKGMKKKIADQTIQAFIIDSQGANLRNSTNGKTPRVIYTQALEEHEVYSIETGAGFWDGLRDRQARVTFTRERIAVRDDLPGLLIDGSRCSNLMREIPNFRKSKVKGIITDNAERRGESHAIDCMEYLCSRRLPWVAPPIHEQRNLMDVLLEEQQRLQRKYYLPESTTYQPYYSYDSGFGFNS